MTPDPAPEEAGATGAAALFSAADVAEAADEATNGGLNFG